MEGRRRILIKVLAELERGQAEEGFAAPQVTARLRGRWNMPADTEQVSSELALLEQAGVVQSRVTGQRLYRLTQDGWRELIGPPGLVGQAHP